VVEEPDVVVGLLQRLDLSLDELIELGEVGDQIGRQFEIHRGSIAKNPETSRSRPHRPPPRPPRVREVRAGPPGGGHRPQLGIAEDPGDIDDRRDPHQLYRQAINSLL
jgi:hypothetical protein